MEAGQQTVGETKQHHNLITKCISHGDIKCVLNVKTNTGRVNAVLKVIKKSFKVKLFIDIGLFIYFLGAFINSIVHFAIKQDPLVYNVVCNVVTFIGLVIGSCTLAYRFCKYYCDTKEIIRIEPQLENREQDEGFDADTFKELVLDILKETFIYPSVICTMYGFINEKSWQFANGLAGFQFFAFAFSLFYDAVYTKLKYIWAMQKFIISVWYESDDNRKIKVMKCCLSSLLFTPHIGLFILIHWLIPAIIGVRIYVDNFSTTEIDQVNRSSETGGYKVAPYTAYMISCGIYLPVASVIVFFILSRACFSDEIDSTCEKIFHFLVDPVAYIATIFLMVPFVAFCVGIYLPDYDSSFEVDANAKDAAGILGVTLIIAFLLFNIKATVIFTVIIVIVGIIVVILFVGPFYGAIYCVCKVMGRDNSKYC